MSDPRRRVLKRGVAGIDPKAAIEKMRAYQLLSPSHYVLELVRVAVLSGAAHIGVYNDSDDLIIHFEGAPPSVDELERLMDSLFNASDRRLRLLAVALNAALGLGPRFIDLVVSDDAGAEAAQRVRWTPSKDRENHPFGRVETLSIERPPQLPGRGMMVHLREAFGVAVIREWFSQRPLESGLLVAHADRLEVPLTVMGRAVTAAREAPLATATWEGSELKVCLEWVSPTDPHGGTLSFYELGVLLERRTLRELNEGAEATPVLPVRVAVLGRELPTNASRSKVDLSRGVGAALVRAWAEALDALVRQLFAGLDAPDEAARAPYEDALLTLLVRAAPFWPDRLRQSQGLGVAAVERVGEVPSALLAALIEKPLVPLATGQRVSPRSLGANKLQYAVWSGPEAVSSELSPWLDAVLWRVPSRAGVKHFVDSLETVNADRAVQTARENYARRQRFLAQAEQPVRAPSRDGALLRVPFASADLDTQGALRIEGEKTRGELVAYAPPADAMGRCTVMTFVAGRALSVEALDIAAVNLDIALEAPEIEANPEWNGVVKAPQLNALLDRVRVVFAAAVEAALGRWQDPGAAPDERPRPEAQALLVRAALDALGACGDPLKNVGVSLAPVLQKYPKLIEFEAWPCTERGRYCATATLIETAQRLGVCLHVSRRQWEARRDGRPVLHTLEPRMMGLLRRVLPPSTEWVDLAGWLPTAQSRDLKSLLPTSEREVLSRPFVAREGALFRATATYSERRDSALYLGHHRTLIERRVAPAVLLSMVAVIEDDALIAKTAPSGARTALLSAEAEASLATLEVELLAVLAEAVARAPTAQTERVMLLAALGRLRSPSRSLLARFAAETVQRLRAQLGAVPAVELWGAGVSGRWAPVDGLGALLGLAEGAREVPYITEVPEGLEPDEMRAVWLRDRSQQSVYEAALGLPLRYAGAELPARLKAQVRRRAEARLEAQSPVAWALSGTAPTRPRASYASPELGAVLAALPPANTELRVEVIVRDRVAVSLSQPAPMRDASGPWPFVARVRLAAPDALNDTLDALTPQGQRAVFALIEAAVPAMIDAIFETLGDGGEATPAMRAVVLRWASGLRGRRREGETQRLALMARCRLWFDVTKQPLALETLITEHQRLRFVVLADAVRWRGPDTGEDPPMLRVERLDDARALAAALGVKADDQSIASEKLQRSRKLRSLAAERVRLDGSPAFRPLGGRLEQHDASLGVGELRLVERPDGLHVWMFTDDGQPREVTLPSPVGIDLAIASAELDPEAPWATLTHQNVAGRALDVLRAMLDEGLEKKVFRDAPPWALRALRWHLVSASRLSPAASQWPLFRDTEAKPITREALDLQSQHHGVLGYMLEAPVEAIASSEPGRRVVVLDAEALRWVSETRKTRDYRDAIADDIAARRWAETPKQAEIKVLGDRSGARFSRRFVTEAARGEVLLLDTDRYLPSQVAWWFEGRPLGDGPFESPWPSRVALESPRLSPNPRRTAPLANKALDGLRKAAREAVDEALAEAHGVDLRRAPRVALHHPQSPSTASQLARFVGWVWLAQEDEPHEVELREGASTRAVRCALAPNMLGALAPRTRLPLSGKLWVQHSAQETANFDREAALSNALHWAWHALLVTTLEEARAEPDEDQAWHAVFAALSAQLRGAPMRRAARAWRLPGTTLDLADVATRVEARRPFYRDEELDGATGRWRALLEQYAVVAETAPEAAEAAPEAAPKGRKKASKQEVAKRPKAAPEGPAPTQQATIPEARVTARSPLERAVERLQEQLARLGVDAAQREGITLEDRKTELADPMVAATRQGLKVYARHPALVALMNSNHKLAVNHLCLAAIGALRREHALGTAWERSALERLVRWWAEGLS